MTRFDIAPASLDNPLYYLSNAQQVIRFCLHNYADLFDSEEIDTLKQLLMLPEAAQALLVRMVMRKGDLFRTDNLKYNEIGDIAAAIHCLSDAQLISTTSALEISALNQVLKKDELLQLAKLWLEDTIKIPTQKAALVQCLNTHLSDVIQTWQQWSLQSHFTLVKLECSALFERLRLIFFGNLYQSWTEFVLTELGLQQFETVPFHQESRAFSSRAEVDLYLHLEQLKQRIEQGEALARVCQDVPDESDSEWINYRRHKIIFQLGHMAERAKDLNLALSLYDISQHRDARIRELRILEKQQPAEQVLARALTALDQIEQPEARVSLTRIASRAAKKLRQPFTVPSVQTIPTTHLELAQIDNLRVEQRVIQHYSDEQHQLYHVENSLFNALFALLFWPALFAPIKGAFFNPFQSGPADLYRPEFLLHRKAMIDQGFSQLRSGEYKTVMRSCWRNKHGLSCSLIFWPMLSEELLKLALEYIPAEHLETVFKHLLLDLRNHRRGMPDLIEFDLENRHYRLIEVKGPGDRLQDHQRLWIDKMLGQGLPVSVCTVSWLADL